MRRVLTNLPPPQTARPGEQYPVVVESEIEMVGAKPDASTESTLNDAAPTEMHITGPLAPPDQKTEPESLRPESSAYLLSDPNLKEILLSDVGVESLLLRLKQSIHTCKEYAVYIKKLATIESEHSAHLKKAARTMTDVFKRPDLRKGTLQNQLLNMVKTTDRVGDAGNTFIDSMHRIHDELNELVKNMERQRKTIKETALRHEKNLLDAEGHAEKAKVKYDSTCEELERARTGDPSSKNKLGFKPKSEEDLHRRMTIAEVDYQQKVDTVQRMRRELVERLRVDTVRKLQNLVLECDQALSLQILRSANLTETLQLNRGFVISPIKPKNSPTANLPLKEMACKIDSELDYYNYVWSIPKQKAQLNRKVITFRKHPSLGGPSGSGSSSGGSASKSGPGGGPSTMAAPNPGRAPNRSSPSSGFVDTKPQRDRQASATSSSSSRSAPPPSVILGSGTAKTGPILGPATPSAAPNTPSLAPTGPMMGPGPILGTPGTPIGQPSQPSPALNQGPQDPPAITVTNSPSQKLRDPRDSDGNTSNSSNSNNNTSPDVERYDPAKHGLAVYGTPLDEMLEYEEGTVPRIVYQCVQAIDNFGLEVEGIYRTNGNSLQVQEIRREFDIDAGAVDLLRPNENVNDIHSVASALKQYFQSLPDPLLTKEFHREFINAANIKDDIRRRDTIHSIINKLPDPNYTTLRYLIFHLYRVQEREAVNRMSVTNLGIVWGPTLMNTDYSNVGEMAVQSRVIETILINAYAIFEAE